MRPALALIAAVAVLCGGGAAALAQPAGEGPMRRPGLWELKMRAEGGGRPQLQHAGLRRSEARTETWGVRRRPGGP